jgi:hypothetical protein
MRSDITKNYYYTGDYWGYTKSLNNDGITYTYSYFYTRKVKMNINVNLLGELIISSPEKMQLTGHIKNLIDKNGEEIYTDGVWEIKQTAPLLAPLGIKDGYQYRAILIEGQI